MTDWRRHAIGVFGVLLLVAFLAIGLTASSSDSNAFVYGKGVAFKAGLLLVVLWLALPSVERLFKRFPAWMWYVAGLGLLAAALQRHMIGFVAVLFLVLMFFQIVSWFLSGLNEKT